MCEIKRISGLSFVACAALTAICLLVSAGIFFWENDLEHGRVTERPTADEIELAVNSLDREKLAEFFTFVLNGHREISASLADMISAGRQFTYILFLAFALLFAGFARSFRRILKLTSEPPR